MKRINNLYDGICSIENLQLADTLARKGKGFRRDIVRHDQNRNANILALHQKLITQTFHTSSYSTFKIYEPKERDVFSLPHYPDHIVHYALMIYLEQIFTSTFTADTYCCIKGRGVHAALSALKKALRNEEATTYCCQIDIKKFYPNINHSVLKQLLRKKFKDQKLLYLLDDLIDSAPGLPIGNYPSIYLSNFYLTYFDHWVKKTFKVKYFRYADDMVFLASSKKYLHELLARVRFYLSYHLKLKIKGNYQIFPVDSRGINFLGYNSNHNRILIRKNIKKRFARMLRYHKNPASIAAYNGWLKHCDSKHLLEKLLPTG